MQAMQATQALQPPVDSSRYAKCVEVSKRIRWDIDRDVIRGREFDFSRTFLPRSLTLVDRLEFLAGLPSPDEDRDRRMQYQVDRLAASMSGEIKRQPVADEAGDAEHQWLTMYALPEADFKAYGERIKHALSTINRG